MDDVAGWMTWYERAVVVAAAAVAADGWTNGLAVVGRRTMSLGKAGSLWRIASVVVAQN